MLTGNGTAILNQGAGTGGTLESLGNNLVSLNGANSSGTITPLTPF
jgi:hypothetical protein